MLPAVERAHIEPVKVRDYLLSAVHPVGRFKAVVFEALGYKAEDWERLRDDLLTLARTTEAVAGQDSAFGQKYEVRLRQQITFTSFVRPGSIAGWMMTNPGSLRSTKRCVV